MLNPRVAAPDHLPNLEDYGRRLIVDVQLAHRLEPIRIPRSAPSNAAFTRFAPASTASASPPPSISRSLGPWIPWSLDPFSNTF